MSEKSRKLAHHAALLNLLVCPVNDSDGKPLPVDRQPYAKFLPMLEPSETDRVFKFKGLQELYALFHRYYSQYGKTPDKLTFEGLIHHDPEFLLWYGPATKPEKVDFETCLTYLYKPVADIAYRTDQAVSIILKIRMLNITAEISKDANNKANTGNEVFEDFSQKVQALQTDITQLREDTKFSITNTRTDIRKAKDFKKLGGLRTVFPRVILRTKGITGIIAPSKIGKTRFSLYAALDLAERGFDVAYWDFENGDLELTMRYYQAIVYKVFGYTIPIECFYAGSVIDCDKIKEEFGLDLYDPCHVYDQGERCFKVESWSVLEKDEDGVDRDNWFIKPVLMEAVVPAPLPGNEEHWEETDFPSDYECCWDLDYVIENHIQPYIESLPGTLKICHIVKPTMADVESKIVQYLADNTSAFFKHPRKRVSIYDWVGNLTGYGEVWKASRRIYAEAKDLQKKYNMYTLVIDGIANVDMVSKPRFNPSLVWSKDNRQIKYDVANLFILAQTDEERTYSRCLRLVTSEARYMGSGSNSVTYLQNDPNYSILQEITEAQHKILNPEYWEEQKNYKKKKQEKNEEYQQEQELNWDALTEL